MVSEMSMTMTRLCDVDLGGGEADARRRVHGFGHVADELDQLRVEVGDRRCNFSKTRVGVFEDGQECHSLPNARYRMQNPC